MATGPVVTLKKLWRHNRWLTLSFLITLTLALFFIIRASVFFVYWQNHTDEPIEGWMTVRYIANSYRVDPELVHDAIGLPRTGPDRRPLIRIAREDGRPLDQMATTIIEAIEADRKARGIPNSDLPDPVPSGQP
ncbi:MULTISPECIES: hypothetical protein [unclassified Hoeflea]|jgi:hypothetical protein|uniref:hypothetical protein n=1 Tax=unclassified Hoeflea TaxID=2614931 RepID=UPI002B003848|nr:hypothetical protein [Hoeflea sp.]